MLSPCLSWAQDVSDYDFPAEQITINTPEDITTKRQQLINYIWGSDGWPTARVPGRIDTDITYSFYNYLKTPEGNLARVDEYTVYLENGFSAALDHFIPTNPNGKLFIYHAGHGYGYQWEDSWVNGGRDGLGLIIPGLLKRGYAVLAISLPLQGGPVPNQFIPDEEGDWILYNSLGHNQMFQYLRNPFSYFVDPLIITLNYLEDNFNYSEINMTGLSGGGWATTFYAALDTRIRFSIPVAGTMPLYLRKGFEGYGDAEQGWDYDGILGVVNYVDMYIMGSYGEGRGQLQIHNQFDNCCFYDNLRNLVWVDPVKQKIDALGIGRYNYFRDDSTDVHQVSKRSFRELLKFIDYYSTSTSSLTISEQIADTLLIGDSTKFEIGSNAPNVAYKWQVNFNDGFGFKDIVAGDHYRGLETSTLYIDSVSLGMHNYSYRCLLSGDNVPSTTTYSLILKVVNPPAFTYTTLASPVLCADDHATFNVVATGDSLHYQWQMADADGGGFHNLEPGEKWSGVNTASLNVWDLSGLEGREFRCVVSNKFGQEITSATTTFSYASMSIVDQPVDTSVASGTTATFSVRAEGNITGYQWQVKVGDDFVNVEDNEKYSGSTEAVLLIRNVPSTFDQNIYRAVIIGVCETQFSENATLKLYGTVPIIVHARKAESPRASGGRVSLEVKVEGDGLIYQWQASKGTGYRDLVSQEGFTGSNESLLTIEMIGDSLSGYSFRCVITSPSMEPLVSEDYLLIVSPFMVSRHPENVSVCVGQRTILSVKTETTAKHYQWQVDIIDGHGFVDLIDNELYAGTKNDTLVLKGESLKMSGYSYRCVATNIAGKKIISNAAELIVSDYPIVDFQIPIESISQCAQPISLRPMNQGGVFNGAGVIKTVFDPHDVAPGRSEITYSFTNAGGCTASITKSILVYDCTQESQYLFNILASPNPSRGVVGVTFETLKPVKLSTAVYNSSGRVVKRDHIDVDEGRQSLVYDLTDQPKGLYLIVLFCEGESNVKRIVLD